MRKLYSKPTAMLGLFWAFMFGFILNTQAAELNRPNAISILALSPNNGVVGNTITIVGSDLSGVTVTFAGGIVAPILSNNGFALTVQVPAGAITGPLVISRGAESVTTTTSFTILAVPSYCVPSHTAGCVGNGVGRARILTTPVNFTNTCASTNGPSYTVLSPSSNTTTTLTAAQAYTIEITPSGTVNCGIGFWGDWNANGTFETTEYTSFGSGNVAGTLVSRSVTLPATVTPGLTAIRVRTNSGVLNNGSSCQAFTSGETVDFFVTLQASAPAPSITSFTPAGGRVGDVITVNGANLTGATFRFNGTIAVTNTNTGTQAQIVVPTGASTGRISVTTPGGTTVSNFDFTVFGATDYVMSTTAITSCLGTFYSPNSPGNYPNNSNITQVISPDVAGNQVRLDFTQFVLAVGGGPGTGDRLQIFNGPTITSPALHSGTGYVGTRTPFSVQASNPTGQLTLVFVSDNNNNAVGFTADLSCVEVTGPGISGFTPATGAVGTTVTISGFNFNVSPGLQVRFNGTLATVTANTDNSITVTVPTGATTGPITVTNGAGTATSTSGFTVPGANPTITSFTPNNGSIGSLVTITGTNLLPITQVRFTAAFGPGANATVISNDGITLVVSVPNNAGTGPITVQTSAGTVVSTASYTVNATPTITNFTASGAVGSQITVQGANFAPGGVEPTILINGIAATVVNFGGNFAQVTVPAGATTGLITVTTSVGTVNSSSNFIVLESPVITNFTPNTGPAGTNVTVTGSNLTGGTFAFNGTTASALSNDGTTAVIVVPTGATTGFITVSSPNGSGTSNPRQFNVQVPPSITTFTPTSGPIGTVINITGTGFTGGTTYQINGITAGGGTTSNTTARITVSAGTTTGPIRVSNTSGATVTSTDFTVTGLTPTITSFTPASGPVGTTVTVNGTNFISGTTVLYGGNPVATTLLTQSQLTFVIPAGATSGLIIVSNASGVALSTSNFTVTGGLIPTITSFTPVSGSVGEVITINGTNFNLANSEVRFNGVLATTLAVNSTTNIQVVIPVGATTGPIAVTTPLGTGTSATNFTVVVPIPTITFFTPDQGGVGGTTTIFGSAFTGATSVTFNGTNALFVVNDDNTITATVPAGATSGVIRVTTAGGTAVSFTPFTITTLPVVSAVSPLNAVVGATVTISGSNLTGATSVTLNGQAVTIISNTANQIQVRIPVGATSGFFEVTTPAGIATGFDFFTVDIAPTITAIRPTTGNVGDIIEIDGAGLGTAAISINGTPATLVGISANGVQIQVPVGATTGFITAVNAVGSTTSTSVFTVTNLRPNIISFTPTSGVENTIVTVSGFNLGGVTSVRFGTIDALFFVISGNSLQAIVPTGLSGSNLIFVDGVNGRDTSSQGFTITVPSFCGTPTITQPRLFPQTTSNSALVAAGSAYSFKFFGSRDSVYVFSTCNSASGEDSFLRIYDRTGTTIINQSDDGGSYCSGLSASIEFTPTVSDTFIVHLSRFSCGPLQTEQLLTYFKRAITALPVILNFEPASGLAGTLVEISGANFTGVSAVRLNGVSTVFNTLGGTRIQFTVPVGATTGPITVTNASGTGTSSGNYTVLTATSPQVTFITPTSGATGSVITINGSNLGPNPQVFINGVAATNVSVDPTNTIITATVADGTTTGTIRVTTINGSFVTTDPFVVARTLPVIVAVTPNSGVVGTTITITGSSLANPTSVSFNGTPATVTASSNNSITVTVPTGATSGFISVGNEVGVGFSPTVFSVILPLPTIANFSPSAGSRGSSVTINGTNLSGSSVFFGSVAGTITSNTATRIQVTVPPTAITAPITVSTIAGTAVSGSSFTVILPPAITSISPLEGIPGDTITVIGTDLNSASNVALGATFVSNIVSNTSTQIRFIVPVGAVSAAVRVTTGFGTTASTDIYTVIQAPQITSFSPSSGSVGTNVTLVGVNFLNSTIRFNGVLVTSASILDNRISAQVPSGATTGFITVSNRAGVATATIPFTINGAGPVITSFDPAQAAIGTNVVITGANFTGATNVLIGGTRVVATFATISDNQIRFTVPAGTTDGPIIVFTPNGSDTSTTNFRVNTTLFGAACNGTPFVNGGRISPISDERTLLSETGFAYYYKFFGSADSVYTFSTCRSGSGAGNNDPFLRIYNSRNVNTILVENDDNGVVCNGQFASLAFQPTAADTFYVVLSQFPCRVLSNTTILDYSSRPVNPAPFIYLGSPQAGSVGSTVVLTGANLRGAIGTETPTITINGVAQTFVATSTNTRVSFTVAAGTTNGRIVIRTTQGADSTSFIFIVNLPGGPTITGFTPFTGTGNTSVRISGTNLTSPTSVSVNGVLAQIVASNATTIDILVPNGAGTGPITVTTATGTITSTGSFIYIYGIPTIASFTPASGTVGTSVRVRGTNLAGLTAVSFNGIAASSISNASDTAFTAVVPATATTGAIAVITPGGTALSSAPFTVIVNTPTINAFTPASGIVGSQVTITGTNLSAASVFFGGIQATNILSNSSTSIIVVVPVGAQSGPITVTTTSGFATSGSSYTVTIPSITFNTPSGIPTRICAGSSATVSVTVTGTPQAGNVFTVQGSNGTGSFATPFIIGSVTSSATGVITIPVSIPGTIRGSGFRYRVLSTAPTVVSGDNGVNILIDTVPNQPIVTTSGTTDLCPGGSVILTAPLATSYLWSNGATTRAITVTTAGTFTVRVINGLCTSNTSSPIAISTFPNPSQPTISASGPLTFCSGNTVTLSGPAGANNYLWSNGATTQSINVTASGSFTLRVSNANGCQSPVSTASVVTVTGTPATPTISAGGSTVLCNGQTVTLNGPAGATAYVWSNGATTRNITVSASGNYSLIVTNAGGCPSASSNVISVSAGATPATPTVTAGGATTFCTGGSVTLTSSVGTAYLWSNGATTRAITVNTSGNYTVQVSNASGCLSLASAATSVIVNTIPATPSILEGGPTTFCSGGSVTLNAPAGEAGYLWSNGATTRSITVNTSGNFTVQVINAAGCTSATSAASVVVVNVTPSQPTITAGGSTTFCIGGSVVLTATGGTNYFWSNGATTSSITVTNSGNFTVQAVNSGCTSLVSAPIAVTVNTVPTTPIITASGSTTFCSGGLVTLTAPASAGYIWNTGETTQSIVVSATGSVTLRTINAAGCTSSTSAATAVTVNFTPAQPTVTVGGATTFCAGGSVTLTAPAGFSTYAWTNGATTRAITATASGTYSVVVGTAAGCTSVASASTVVTVNPVPTQPIITASGPTTFCSGGSVMLSAPAGATSYLWSNGATTPSITVSTSGTFTVSVTNASGCTSAISASRAVVVNPTPAQPTVTVGGPTTFCAGGSVTLTAPAGFSSYAWSNGATTRAITATTTDSYSVVVGTAAGCTSVASASTVVTVNPVPTQPTISASGATTFCTGGSVTLTASAANAYLWSNGATTQTIVASTSGNYSVVAINATGCTSLVSTATTVTVNPIPTQPTISASGATTFCEGGSVTLTAPAGAATYIWSNGASTRSIVATASGNFSVSIVSAAGCTSTVSAATAVTVNPVPTQPSVSAGGATTFCSGGSVTLTATGGTNYIWSNGATTPSITVSASGNYTASVVSLGCTSLASAPIVVVVNALPTRPTITAGGATTFCIGGSVTLTATSGTSYIWSNGATTQSITVSASGSFTVAVTNAAGCTSQVSTARVVTVNALPTTPTITASGSTTLCNGGSVTLTAPTSTNYLWSTGATTASINVSAAGSYSVRTINASGCTSAVSLATAVIVNPIPSTPSITVTGATSFCAGGSATLETADVAGASYLWSNGSITRSIVATAAGTYSVQVISAEGCTSLASTATTITITAQPAAATISVIGTNSICAGDSVTLAGPVTTSAYSWSNGATTQTIRVGASGTYTLTLFNGSCSGTSASETITVLPRPATPVISASGPIVFCSGGDVILTATENTNGYLWSNGATTRSITVSASADLSVVLLGTNGCNSLASAVTQVRSIALPTTPTISARTATAFCEGNGVWLVGPAGLGAYSWSNGATTDSIFVTTSGSYTLQAGGGTCISTASNAITVTVNPIPSVPTITAGGATTFCAGGSVTLSAPAGASAYLWSNGATTETISVSTAGAYSAQVIGANGCPSDSSNEIEVIVTPVTTTPVISAATASTFCEGGSVVLSAAQPADSYLWSTGETTPTITVLNTSNISLVTIDTDACTSAVSNAIAVQVNPIPASLIATANGSTTICDGSSVELTATAGADAYLWSNGATTQTIVVNAAGSYSVVSISAAGCTSIGSNAVPVIVQPITPQPSITAGGPTSVCAGSTVTLTASAADAYLWSTGETTQSIVVSNTSSVSVITTNTGSCESIASAAVDVNISAVPSAPVIAFTGSTGICSGETVTLVAPSGFANYVWSDGSTNDTLIAASAGDYTVQVGNNAVCLSPASAAVTITADPITPTPTIAVTGDLAFCIGDSVVLTASEVADAYLWSNGATTRSITVFNAGAYTLSTSLAGACPSASSAGVDVVVNPLPTTPVVTTTGNTTLCIGENVTLDAPAGFAAYLWSDGSTTQSITVNAVGNYSVLVANASGCVSAESNEVSVGLGTPSTTPTFTVSGPLTFCQGNSVVLTADAVATSYLWSNGATTRSISVTTAGTFSLQVLNLGSCISEASSAVTTIVTPALTSPSIIASGPTTVCAGATVTLTAPAGFDTYVWSNGETTQSITVNASGNFSVTVQNAGTCASLPSNEIAVVVNPISATPTISASGVTTFCQGGSVTLTASASTGSYLWSNGATTQSIVVSANGTFTVQVTDAASCISAASLATTVIVNTIPATPTITLTGNAVLCGTETAQLSAPAGAAAYIWSNGETSQSITSSASATYTVSVISVEGCTSAASAGQVITVLPITATPVITPSGATTFCAGGNVTLTAPLSASYLWSNGATTRAITVNASGSFTVQTTATASCISTVSLATTVVVNPLPTTPTITLTGNAGLCGTETAQLTATAGAAAYIWSNGETTQSITVSSAATYTVRSINVEGCTSAASAGRVITVLPITATPVITPSGATTFCTGGSVTLTAPLSASYLWSTGATTRAITVNTTGSYAVQTTATGSCLSAPSAAVSVIVNAIPGQPVVSVTGDVNFCQGGSVQLSAPTADAYLWSNGATTQNITVNASGSFSVAAISATGCTSIVSTPVVVTVTPTPAQPTITASGATAICDGGSVTLTASATTGNYLWSNGATTQAITVSTAGNYTVQVLNGTCSSLVSFATAVTTAPAPSVPTVTLTGSATLCTGDSVVLTASVSEGYLWSNGATTRSITVRAAGSFTVQATTVAGCTSAISTATAVTLNAITARPVVTPSASTSLCAGGSVILNAPAGFASYIWSNGATTQSITVSTAGAYTVSVQNTGTCLSLPSIPINVTVSAVIPTPVITTVGPTSFCANQDSVVLTAPAGFAIYVWSNGTTNRSITVRSVSGSYSVRVGNGTCASASSVPVVVTVNAVPGRPSINFAPGRRDSLIASIAATSYIWSIDGQVQTQTGRGIKITRNGTYTVIAVSGSGCRGIVSNGFAATSTKTVADITTQVYPNPFQNSLNLSMDNLKDDNVVVNIFDVVGKLVYTEVVAVTNGSVSKELSIGNLPAGSYQLQISTSAGVIQQKLMHNK